MQTSAMGATAEAGSCALEIDFDAMLRGAHCAFSVAHRRLLLLLISVFVSVHAHGDDHDHEHEEDDEDYTKVTYGSAIKLQHKQSGFRLHSHQIKWGSGSGQQSVTGFEGADDPNSLWQLTSGFVANNPVLAAPGTVIKCNDVIRLQHATTKRWLHSHLHASPLTHRQEISGYGEDGGVGSDSGDNWRVECYGGAKEWARDTAVSLLHIDTNKRLYTRRQDAFDNRNCAGCPIIGQLEISAHNTGLHDANAHWQAAEGVFFPTRQQDDI